MPSGAFPVRAIQRQIVRLLLKIKQLHDQARYRIIVKDDFLKEALQPAVAGLRVGLAGKR